MMVQFHLGTQLMYGGYGIDMTDPELEKILADKDNNALFQKVMLGKLDLNKGYLALDEETQKLVWVKGQKPS